MASDDTLSTILRKMLMQIEAEAWWKCPSANWVLRTSFRLTGNPFKSPRTTDEWEPYLDANGVEVNNLAAQLADAENELNDCVFRLFDLSDAEITPLKKEVEH